MVNKILFRETHWAWSVVVLGLLLIITSLFVFDSINQSKQANLDTESATQYQNDLATNTFTPEDKQAKSEPEKQDNDNNNQPAVVPQTQPMPKPEQEPLTWCNYDRKGFAEWWVCKRRAEVGKALPEEWGIIIDSWVQNAKDIGYPVDNSPSKYSVLIRFTSSTQAEFVEQVNPDGSITVSNMNGYSSQGWNKNATYKIQKGDVENFLFID